MQYNRTAIGKFLQEGFVPLHSTTEVEWFILLGNLNIHLVFSSALLSRQR